MPEIYGIITKDEEGKFSLWTEFRLTNEETRVIVNILEQHINEGGSTSPCDTIKELLEEVL